MDYENSFIQPLITYYFGKGYTELEAHTDIIKQYGQFTITYKTIKKWYKVFKSRDSRLSKTRSQTNSKQKYSDEYLIKLIKDNSSASVSELAVIAGYSTSNMYSRLSKIKNYSKLTGNYINLPIKNNSKKPVIFSDNYLIKLIKNNQNFNILELAKVLNCSKSIISTRLIKINSKRDKNSKIKLKNKFKFISDEFIINLINNNPGLNFTKLAKLGKISISTISKRFKKINNNREDGQKLMLINKSANNSNNDSNNSNNDNNNNVIKKPVKKFTNEYLIKIITDNPDLNMLQLSKLLNCSSSTICKRVKQINSQGDKVIYQNKVGQSSGSNKLKDEYLINLINHNAGLNIKELAKLINCSYSTLSSRLKQLHNTNNLNLLNLPETPKLLTDDQLIDIIKQNPNFNMIELSKIIGVTPKTISNRIRKISNSGEQVSYNKEYSKKFKKITDDSLIQLINENEAITSKELSKLLGCSQSTICARLKQINDNRPVNSKINLGIGKSGPQKLFTDEYLINLVTQNPTLNTLELSKLAKCSKSTISSRLKQINSSRSIENQLKLPTSNYKSFGKPKSFSDDYLIKLIKDNSELNIKEIAKICNVSPKTIYRRLVKIKLTKGESINYITKKSTKLTQSFIKEEYN